jgi:hypothetical protein
MDTLPEGLLTGLARHDPALIMDQRMELILTREWGSTMSVRVRDYLVREADSDEVLDIIESWFHATHPVVTWEGEYGKLSARQEVRP